MSDPCDQRPQAAAYLLDALSPAETDAYRRHLQSCASCRQEIEQLAPAANALPASVAPVHAPAALLQRVMADVRAEAELLNAAGPQADRPPRAASWWRAHSGPLAASAGLASAVAVVTVLLISGSSSNPPVIQARLAANVPGRAQVRESAGRAELIVSGIPQPPDGEVYEVWLAKPGSAPAPADALFNVTANGDASVEVSRDLHDDRTLLVTAEPSSGTQHPTSPPIITATLDSF